MSVIGIYRQLTARRASRRRTRPGVTSRKATLLLASGGHPGQKIVFAMNHRQCFRFAIRLLGLCMLIFALGVAASAEWKERVLYSFQGGSSDGATPAGGVVFDSQGNLYGVTSGGGSGSCTGSFQCGIAYQLSPPVQRGGSWTERVLYNFQGNQSGDGSSPGGGLVIDKAGNLYGTTGYGGTGGCVLLGSKEGCGTVYELSPPKTKGGRWRERVLYSFKGGEDGYVPNGDLVFDSVGNLYGATIFGGGKGTTCNSFYQYCGTVFELNPPQQESGKWTEKVLHSFAGGTDGAYPNGALTFNGTGAIYGTTSSGGNQGCKSDSGIGCGTAFKLQPPVKKGAVWTEKTLHRFADGDDGAGPNGGLIFDAKGALYGTAGGGGTGKLGVVFRLVPARRSGWVESVLHDFTFDKGGRNPWGPVTFDESGNLYGTAHAAAGDKFGGVVFSLKSESQGKWDYTILYNFGGAPDGAYPISALVFDKGGILYSTTEGGGNGQSCQGGCGTVFEVPP
jgi:hypothetical protein